MAGFQWNWRQKFWTLLWLYYEHPLACQATLTESYICNARNFVLKVRKMTLSPRIF
jgi:hypothetical protein